MRDFSKSWFSESSIMVASTQFAFGLGTIDAERVEFRYLMQKTFLRRNRDHHASVDQQNGLPKLQVPVPQRQSLAFERGDGKVRPLEKVQHGFRVAGIGARCCLADHA